MLATISFPIEFKFICNLFVNGRINQKTIEGKGNEVNDTKIEARLL